MEAVTRCVWCLLAFGHVRMDGSTVEQVRPSSCRQCDDEIRQEQERNQELERRYAPAG